jgi:hypothetical protein
MLLFKDLTRLTFVFQAAQARLKYLTQFIKKPVTTDTTTSAPSPETLSVSQSQTKSSEEGQWKSQAAQEFWWGFLSHKESFLSF